MNLEILHLAGDAEDDSLRHPWHPGGGLPGRPGDCPQRPAARMVKAIEVNLPRPRTIELKAEKEFGKLCLEIYKLLEEK
jgi:hypothetical protein